MFTRGEWDGKRLSPLLSHVDTREPGGLPGLSPEAQAPALYCSAFLRVLLSSAGWEMVTLLPAAEHTGGALPTPGGPPTPVNCTHRE